MKHSLSQSILILSLLLVSCQSTNSPAGNALELKSFELDQEIKVFTGQTVYVPIYPHIYMHEPSRKMSLNSTLSVRNTDVAQPLILVSVNFYNSNGRLVREYLEQPVILGAMASTNFHVSQKTHHPDPGTAFLVEWVAQTEVTEPVIESVMINAASNQGISFTSPGRVIKRFQKPSQDSK